MISPNLFGLPIFSNLNFVFELSLVLEVFLCSWHATPFAICVVEEILTLGNVFMTFVLPEDRSSIISATSKESANGIPPDTINWLFVITQLS